MHNYTIINVSLQGIGDSGQGFANCVLFCLVSNKIRNRLVRSCCKVDGNMEQFEHSQTPSHSLTIISQLSHKKLDFNMAVNAD